MDVFSLIIHVISLALQLLQDKAQNISPLRPLMELVY